MLELTADEKRLLDSLDNMQKEDTRRLREKGLPSGCSDYAAMNWYYMNQRQALLDDIHASRRLQKRMAEIGSENDNEN